MQKNNWKKCKLGEFCPFKYGKGLLQKDRKKGNIPVFGSNGINDWHSQPYVKTAGLIIGRKGTAGSVHLSKIPFWPIDTTFYIKDEPEKRNLLFTYYLLKNSALKNLVSDSAVPGLNRDAAHALELLIPPLDEQKRIAEVLGAFDDKIELLQKQNKTLEDMAKALFKSWFVDFDVVRAKQKGLPKADIMREYHLTEELYDLFPSSFADSPLGPIPSGWEVKKAQEIADIAIGRTPPRKETKWFSTDSTDTTWISIKDLGNCGVFIGDSSEYLTEDAVSKFKIPMIPTKTVVLSFKLTVGRVAITMKEMCSNEAIAQFKDAMVPVEYLYLLLKHINFSLLGSTSSIATAINSNTIKNMNVLIADSVLLSAFKERTQNLFDKIEINLKQIQTLTELRHAFTAFNFR